MPNQNKQKLYKFHTCSEYLVESASAGDTVINTSAGKFKIRKNGKIHIILDRGTPNEEYLRVSPIK